MYFIGLIVYLALLIGTTFFVGSPACFIDLPSIVVILVLSFSMLLASGLLPDLLRGFKIMGKKENTCTVLELQKTEIAVGMTIKLLLLSGFLGFLIGLVAMLATLGDTSLIGRNLAITMLTMLYAMLIILILLPVQARVKAIIKTLD
jgi:flagellar motor component MotA